MENVPDTAHPRVPPSTWVLTIDPRHRLRRTVGWLLAVGGWAVVEVWLVAFPGQILYGRDPAGSTILDGGWSGLFLVVPFAFALLAATVAGPVLLVRRGRGLFGAEDRIEVAVDHLAVVRRRGRQEHRRLVPRARTLGVALTDEGRTVRIRTDPGGSWTLTELGTPEQRTALTDALVGWVPPDVVVAPSGELPPHLPSGWRAQVTTDGSGVVRARLRPGWAALRALGAAGLVGALWWYGVEMLEANPSGDNRGLGWMLVAMAVSGTALVVWTALWCDAWEAAPGRLLLGSVWVVGGAWRGRPHDVAALRITGSTSSGDDPGSSTSRHHVLQAIGRRGEPVTMYTGSDDDGRARATGAWLAARTGIPLTDTTRTPGDTPR